MPTEKLDPFDPHLVQVMLAMYISPGTLLGKLKAIWDLASRMILLAEEKNPKEVLKTWGAHAKHATSTRSLSSRAYIASAHNLNTHHQGNLLAAAYFGALGEMGVIQKSANFIKKPPASPAEFGEVDEKALLDSLFAPEQLKCQKFLDKVIPHFFGLQLHCYHLVRILESPKGIPADPAKRRSRAAAGGAASNYGEDELISLVSDFLDSQNPKTKYRSIEALFKDLDIGFANVLEDYKGRIGSRSPQSGHELTYGQTLTANGLLRKLKEWKEDPDFRKNLERICTLR